MEEQSILDYLKEKFSLIKRRKLPTFAPDGLQDAETSQESRSAPSPEEGRSNAGPFPWRSLLALLLALIAQRAWEPMGRSLWLGIVCYCFGFGFLIWAYIRKEFRMAVPHNETHQASIDAKVRLTPLLISLPLVVAAFLAFKGNLFTTLNVTFWVLAIVLFIGAIWLRNTEAVPMMQRIRDFINRKDWLITVPRWSLVLFAAGVLILFFRFYQLSAVAPEMTSDHAEKLADVFDILSGKFSIFFPRNTGREPLYIYLAALLAGPLGFGVSFNAIKIAAILGGLGTLVYIYRIGKELGSRWAGLWAMLFCGIAYWPIVIERFALRISFYPLFVAVTLFYLLRGFRTSNRNDFILAGVGLGLGLMGYTPFRIMPIIVIIAFGIYVIHKQSRGKRKQAILWLGIITLTSVLIFLPVLRYWMDNPELFAYRAFTRLGSIERPLPGPIIEVFLSNLWNGLRMFNWDNGIIWVHSVPNRPALDVVSGALFLIGVLFLLIRYAHKRHWLDLFLLLSIPLLIMPSILSLAFPNENPAMNRAAGGLVPVFLILGCALDGLLRGFWSHLKRGIGKGFVISLAIVLLTWSAIQNYDLIFNQYANYYLASAWNTRAMGEVVAQFDQTYDSPETAWVVPFSYWVDTRLPALWADLPERGDMAMWRDNLSSTLEISATKLFIFKPEDVDTQTILYGLYPEGSLSRYSTETENHDFMIYFVPMNDKNTE